MQTTLQGCRACSVRQVSPWSGRQRIDSTSPATGPFAYLAVPGLSAPRAGTRRSESGVSTSGWIFMTFSIAGVLTLLIACYWRLLRQPR
jgi:hypothetical protein